MRHWYKNSIHYLKGLVAEVMETDGSAQVVAFSFALGSFIALLPTFGIGVFIALLLLILFPFLHKPGLLVAFVIWNPLVQIPLYSIGIGIGALLFSGLPVVSLDVTLWDQVVSLTRRVFVGSLIVSSTLSVLSYCLVFILIKKLKGKPIILRR